MSSRSSRESWRPGWKPPLYGSIHAGRLRVVCRRVMAPPVPPDDSTVELPLTFECSQPGQYPCNVTLTADDDIRIYSVHCGVLPTGTQAEMEFTTPLHQTLLQEVPIVSAPWGAAKTADEYSQFLRYNLMLNLYKIVFILYHYHSHHKRIPDWPSEGHEYSLYMNQLWQIP